MVANRPLLVCYKFQARKTPSYSNNEALVFKRREPSPGSSPHWTTYVFGATGVVFGVNGVIISHVAHNSTLKSWRKNNGRRRKKRKRRRRRRRRTIWRSSGMNCGNYTAIYSINTRGFRRLKGKSPGLQKRLLYSSGFFLTKLTKRKPRTSREGPGFHY
ncbi:hypothetical protein ACN38_g7519 [Penicillium nordicum]|uniref:Uncharacterized protein n=1 Tax=Penicillium nordicum TaxID=229535 RepID=A0A0M8P1H3_9EURO|nr:hypothetical protein ACN38_g7519 [Penicillium nordicum]